MRLFAGLSMALLPMVTSAQTAPLELVCSGTAGIVVEHRSSATIRDPIDVTKNKEVSSTSFSRNTVPAVLLVSIDEGGAKVQPDWRGKGWLKVQKFSTTDDAYLGQVTFAIVNKPMLKIDRKTGRVELDTFRGSCEKAAVRPVENKF